MAGNLCECCSVAVLGRCVGCGVGVAGVECLCECESSMPRQRDEAANLEAFGPRVELREPVFVDAVFVPVRDAHWLAEFVDPPSAGEAVSWRSVDRLAPLPVDLPVEPPERSPCGCVGLCSWPACLRGPAGVCERMNEGGPCTGNN